MNYGYEYSQPQGYYYPQPPHPQQPYPTYSAPPYPQNEAEYQPSRNHQESTAESYGYNRNVIPGLGLDSAGHANQPQYPAFAPIRDYAPTGPPSADPGVQWEAHARRHGSRSLAESGARDRNDGSEEGELSEGEMEDIYEPEGDGRPTQTSDLLWQQGAGTEGAAGHSYRGDDARGQYAPGGPLAADSPVAYTIARDRSGSYSPYLSPQEVHENEAGWDGPLDSQSAEAPPNDLPKTSASATNIGEAKKRAQDAISHLWPLNVRFQHYIDEGIDESVLQELFRELGLEIPVPDDLFEAAAPANAPPIQAEEHATTQPEEGEGLVMKSPEVTAREPSQEVKDKSESRKDRIARLLAAKGSKGNSSAPAPTATRPRPKSSAAQPSRTQAEKSRLLQQKMEALEKARELARKRSRQDEPSAVVAKLGSSAEEDEPYPGDERVGTSSQAPSGTEPSRKTELLETEPDTSIPGLFLSSEAKDSQPKKTSAKRPVASDFEYSASVPFKRPFGQVRDSQPFLIHVSDDEDDEEMDIDSTGQHSPSVHRVGSPSRRTSSFLDRTLIPTRQLSSPRPVNTPPTPSGDNGGRPDLESMNKKIEAMKRKIAEAEARKKTKMSQDGSPAPSQSNEPMHNGLEKTNSVESTAEPTPSSGAGDTAAVATQLSPEATSKRLPKASDLGQSSGTGRRSRSRAASERLPLIEAHRREQILKLQALQAQVASIELEIAEDLKEESRLKEEAEAAWGSDQEQESEHVLSEPPPGASSLHEVVLSNLPIAPMQRVRLTRSAEGAALPSVQHSPRTEAMETSAGSSNADDAHMAESPRQEQAKGPDFETVDEPPATGEQAGSPSTGSDERGAGSNDPTSAATDSGAEVPLPGGGDAEMEGSGDDFDGYEPVMPESAETGDGISAPTATEGELALETSDNEMQGVNEASSVEQQISTGQVDSTSEPEREVEQTQGGAASGPRSSFAPYDTPLQYFRAYRFHPQFNESVAGGLRSLTYSNKIDVRKPVCPDQLAGQECPRGAQCEFQHFESMQPLDDQILLELGAYGSLDEEQKNEFINGLRQLLTDYRNRKVKDFKTISEGIIEYRARFHGDKTKVLPLGNVTL